jgi:hypothetical protein
MSTPFFITFCEFTTRSHEREPEACILLEGRDPVRKNPTKFFITSSILVVFLGGGGGGPAGFAGGLIYAAVC